MKKLIIIISLVALAAMVQAQSQRIENERPNLLIYSDSTVLNGGDTLKRLLYGFIPVDIGAQRYVYQYTKIYLLNSVAVLEEPLTYIAGPEDTLIIGPTTWKYPAIYPHIIEIDSANWQTASWQTYLQKLHSQ